MNKAHLHEVHNQTVEIIGTQCGDGHQLGWLKRGLDKFMEGSQSMATGHDHYVLPPGLEAEYL